MRFSERYGYKAVRDVIQIDSISQELRNGLWSLLKLYIWDKVQPGSHYISTFRASPEIKTFCTQLWFNYYKWPLDNLGGDWSLIYQRIRDDFFQSDWFEVYDFLEFAALHFPYRDRELFVAECNALLEREASAYRLIDNLAVRITEEEQIAEIEAALETARGAVRTHFQRALELLSNKEQPDYRNSIKESISAIESLVGNTVGQKGTLGLLLKKLEDEIGLHPALRNAFSNLYGYTSDEAGIRHAILESENVSFEDAKFFLVTCSAFANYVQSKVSILKSDG